MQEIVKIFVLSVLMIGVVAAYPPNDGKCHPYVRMEKISCCSLPTLIAPELKAACKDSGKIIPTTEETPLEEASVSGDEQLEALEHEIDEEYTEEHVSDPVEAHDESSDGEEHHDHPHGHHHHHRHHHHHHRFHSRRFGQMMCTSECYLNKTGIVEDGVLNHDRLTSYLHEVLPDEEDLSKRVSHAIEVCVERQNAVKEKHSRPKEAGKEHHHFCSPYAHRLFNCVAFEILKTCPSEKRSQEPQCERTWKNVEVCANEH